MIRKIKKKEIDLFKKIKKHFYGIFYSCNNKFWFSCGSYLIDGQRYKYDNSLLKKQILLYNLAKKNNSILEIGVYMGHSMLIMLSANPKIKILGIDNDARFSPKAVRYLKKNYRQSKLKLILGDSIEVLKKIRENYDLYHIDGDHSPKKIYNEIIQCLGINKNKTIKILFDDIDMMKNVERVLLKSFKIKTYIKPKMKFANLYVEMYVDDKSIKKFKDLYYFFLITDFPRSFIIPVFKKTLRLIIKILIGKKFRLWIANVLEKNFNNIIFLKISKKIKNI
jgi:hypothetical protein